VLNVISLKLGDAVNSLDSMFANTDCISFDQFLTLFLRNMLSHLELTLNSLLMLVSRRNMIRYHMDLYCDHCDDDLESAEDKFTKILLD